MRLYAGAAFRAAQLPVHPLDFRASVGQIGGALTGYQRDLGPLVDLEPTLRLAAQLNVALESLNEAAGAVATIAEARPYNDALLRIGRQLVPVLYTRDGRFRQDPALDQPLLPDLAAATTTASHGIPDGVVRVEMRRARNRIEHGLMEAAEVISRCL